VEAAAGLVEWLQQRAGKGRGDAEGRQRIAHCQRRYATLPTRQAAIGGTEPGGVIRRIVQHYGLGGVADHGPVWQKEGDPCRLVQPTRAMGQTHARARPHLGQRLAQPLPRRRVGGDAQAPIHQFRFQRARRRHQEARRHHPGVRDAIPVVPAQEQSPGAAGGVA
jgi:hypothetical protein